MSIDRGDLSVYNNCIMIKKFEYGDLIKEIATGHLYEVGFAGEESIRPGTITYSLVDPKTFSRIKDITSQDEVDYIKVGSRIKVEKKIAPIPHPPILPIQFNPPWRGLPIRMKSKKLCDYPEYLNLVKPLILSMYMAQTGWREEDAWEAWDLYEKDANIKLGPTTMYHALPYSVWEHVKLTGLQPAKVGISYGGLHGITSPVVFLGDNLYGIRGFLLSLYDEDPSTVPNWYVLKVTIPPGVLLVSDPYDLEGDFITGSWITTSSFSPSSLKVIGYVDLKESFVAIPEGENYFGEYLETLPRFHRILHRKE